MVPEVSLLRLIASTLTPARLRILATGKALRLSLRRSRDTNPTRANESLCVCRVKLFPQFTSDWATCALRCKYRQESHQPSTGDNSGRSSVSLLELRAFLMLGIKGRAKRGSHIQIKRVRGDTLQAQTAALLARPWRLSPPPSSPLSLPPPPSSSAASARPSVRHQARARRHVNRRCGARGGGSGGPCGGDGIADGGSSPN